MLRYQSLGTPLLCWTLQPPKIFFIMLGLQSILSGQLELPILVIGPVYIIFLKQFSVSKLRKIIKIYYNLIIITFYTWIFKM